MSRAAVSLKVGCSLSPFKDGDQESLIRHINDLEIYQNTLRIPHPYGRVEADAWVSAVAKHETKVGRVVSWAIRNEDMKVIGGIGFDFFVPGSSHQAEIGYWLGRAYWGRGIMTEAVWKVTEIGFEELNLVRITAHIISENHGSARVLEKTGFSFEGHLRKLYFKDGKYSDGKLYAKLR